jgi:hypothetical protein
MTRAVPPPRSARPSHHAITDLEAFLTSRLLAPVDTLAASGWRAIRAGWRRPGDAEVRVSMIADRLQMPASLAGGCMCGAIRYRISAAPIATGLCHCDRCRPQSGSAFSTVIIIRRSTLAIEGETAVFEDIGSSGLHVGRRYCPRCASPLTTEPDVTPDLMFVRPAASMPTNGSFR